MISLIFRRSSAGGIDHARMVEDIREKHASPEYQSGFEKVMTDPFGSKAYAEYVEQKVTDSEAMRLRAEKETAEISREVTRIKEELSEIQQKADFEKDRAEKAHAQAQRAKAEAEKAKKDAAKAWAEAEKFRTKARSQTPKPPIQTDQETTTDRY